MSCSNLKNKPGKACCGEADCTDYIVWVEDVSPGGAVFDVYLNGVLVGSTDDWAFASPSTIYAWTTAADLVGADYLDDDHLGFGLVPHSVPDPYVYRTAALPPGSVPPDGASRVELRHKSGGVPAQGRYGMTRLRRSGARWVRAAGDETRVTELFWQYDPARPADDTQPFFFAPCYRDGLQVIPVGCNGPSYPVAGAIVSLLKGGAVVDQQAAVSAAPGASVTLAYPAGDDAAGYSLHAASPSGRFKPYDADLTDEEAAAGRAQVQLTPDEPYVCSPCIGGGWPAARTLHYSSPALGSGAMTYGTYPMPAYSPVGAASPGGVEPMVGWLANLVVDYPGYSVELPKTTPAGAPGTQRVFCPPAAVQVMLLYGAGVSSPTLACGLYVFYRSVPRPTLGYDSNCILGCPGGDEGDDRWTSFTYVRQPGMSAPEFGLLIRHRLSVTVPGTRSWSLMCTEWPRHDDYAYLAPELPLFHPMPQPGLGEASYQFVDELTITE